MKKLLTLAASASVLAFAGCQTAETDVEPVEAAAPPAAEVEEVVEVEVVKTVETASLADILAAQPDEVQARYQYRHPAETLEFFGVEPGMTVVEALPGGGWYSKILLPYLGPEGKLVGAHYPDDIWPRFGFFDEEAIAGAIERNANWAKTAKEWGIENSAKVKSVYITDIPEKMDGKADAVLFIRALHNLNRFDAETGYMKKTLANTYDVLKPGGIVGVVQHRGPEGNPDEWATGAAGYLKQSALIEAFENAGFVLEASSEINANPKDTPTADDIVWRLPPSFNGTEEGTPEREAVAAIGESDRMTLLFRKPEKI